MVAAFRLGGGQSRAEAIQAVRSSRPDLLLVDLTLWEESGLDLIQDLQREGRAPKALVYSMHEDWLHVRQSFQFGPVGYVTKRELLEVLLEAVRMVLAGGIYTSPRAARALSDPANQVHLAGLALLSAQERDLFRKLGEGRGVSELAEGMGISRKTVEFVSFQQACGNGPPATSKPSCPCGRRACHKDTVNSSFPRRPCFAWRT